MKPGFRSKENRRLRPEVDQAYGEAPRLMVENKLPLYRDAGLEVEYRKKVEGTTETEAVKLVTERIEFIQQKASIPTKPRPKIKLEVEKVVRLRKERMKVVTIDKRTGKLRDQGKWRQKKKNNKKTKMKLSDIENKLINVALFVPEIEKAFFEDQNGERKFVIGEVDKEKTKKNLARLKERQDEEKRKVKSMKDMEKAREVVDIEILKYHDDAESGDDSESGESVETEDDSESVVSVETEKPKKRWRLRNDEKEELTDFISMCDRYGVSDTGTAHLYNVSNERMKNDHKFNQSQINKLRKTMRKNQVNNLELPISKAIGFDERKNLTKVRVGFGARGIAKFEIKKQEHCPIVLWPGEVYAGHVVPMDGSAMTLAKNLHRFTEERRITMEENRGLVSDGCEKMVGWKEGVHACFEKIMKRAFQRIICFFHHIELSFKVILKLYGVVSSSPDKLVGPIGVAVGAEVKVVQSLYFC